ncbi:putative ABC-type branched-chain amino acid transport system, periplasmic component [Bradyrhizobium sp. ORS 278]|uniref:ABC transporter substrate-binding protein n=1 Tax=Bradyrhizobium sp. (strain ORS 278) TaxID=114615 RepID=UPI0001508C1B|nr:ABC transporter substrate-binding protein [Bradyrhizobium sp. ORS 278]CAL80179.1 putative ABC-type branched-chain amino acid transport system, periplasmic component [Bradyrhizobium sp. ORS 278]
MIDVLPQKAAARGSLAHARIAAVLLGTIVASGAFGMSGVADAAPGEAVSVARQLGSRVGPIIGSALACRDIARPRIQAIIEKFQLVIREAATSEADRDELTRLLDRYVADGRSLVTSGRMDCRSADRQLADLEQSIAAPPAARSNLPAVTLAPPSAVAATMPAQVLPPAVETRGVTQNDIKFGMVIPFGGPVKESGRQLRIGVEAAFNRVNEAGGINGRVLKLVTADDGYDPSRTLDAMKQLYEKEQVFGFICNFGSATAAVAIPYALERRALFFAPYTGANVGRHDPPDRYVFNYRPSYAEETDALVRYLVKVRKLQPRQIVVFAQNDAFGDAGFAGVAKAFRTLGANESTIVRVNYPRNSIDVDDAISQLRLLKTPVRAVIMLATTRAAAKFIEKARDVFPGAVFANISAVGGSALASELMLLGPRYTENVIVTQTVPGVSGYSSLVLDYKNALAKYFPGEAPDYMSLEGYISASVLIEGLKRAGRSFDTEQLVETLETMRDLDLGLGVRLGFGRSEHQASHKIWGTALDESGNYQPIELD